MFDRFSGKTLYEVLQEIDDKTLIYLGAQSSFFDIATAEILKDDEYMGSLSLSLYQLAGKKAQSAKSNFFKALKNPPAWKGPKDDQSEEDSIKEYIDSIPRWNEQIKIMQRNAITTESYFETFIPLKDRIVKSVYPRIDETGVCIIVHGNEIGGYWMVSEKENGKKMFDKNEYVQ